MCYKTKINAPLMYEVLDKDTIRFEILPHLICGKTWLCLKNDLLEVIQCILYKLKTGCQWHMLPVSSVFTRRVLHYKTVYGHFRKWSRNGEWEKVWGIVLKRYKSFLDMSSVDLDGSHTTALRGGGMLWLPRTQEKEDDQPYTSQTAKEYRLSYPLQFRVRTTMFTTSPRLFRSCSRGLRPRPCPHRDSFLTQMQVLAQSSSGGDAMNTRCSQTLLSTSAEESKGRKSS